MTMSGKECVWYSLDHVYTVDVFQLAMYKLWI